MKNVSINQSAVKEGQSGRTETVGAAFKLFSNKALTEDKRFDIDFDRLNP